MHERSSFDYIVVGGGSAGCVVANRLILDHGAKVLLLDAGVSDKHRLIRMPAGTYKMMMGATRFLKRYESIPQPNLGGRSLPVPQANVIGGGSSVNVMAYMRGSKEDYNSWTVEAGGFPWGWKELLPYFRRQEGNRRLDNEAHGGDGPLKVGDPSGTAPISDMFVRTLQRLGIPFTHDFNGGDTRGVGYHQSTIAASRRCSAADAFLTPILDHPRLTVRTGASVTAIRFKGACAVGVDYQIGGRFHTALSESEVILTAGTLATPKLLMLSGVGPAEHLAEHGIEVLVDLPGVGKNLQDHQSIVLTANTLGSHGYFGEDRGWRLLKNIFRYAAFGDGPIASSGVEVMAFTNLTDPQMPPSVQVYCVGVLWPSLDDGSTSLPGVTLMANLLKPGSRGNVKLRSKNPASDPLIDLNWLAAPEDQACLLKALKFLRQIACTDPLASVIGSERLPGASMTSDEDLLAYIRRTVETNYHPVGTCRMGAEDDPSAVLTPDLRVRGVDRLRVMDASMMPTIIGANINATVMAVADRGVDLMMSGKRQLA